MTVPAQHVVEQVPHLGVYWRNIWINSYNAFYFTRLYILKEYVFKIYDKIL